jgi:hypothetical protein
MVKRLAILLLALPCLAATWYCDIDNTGSGNNNGTSWANAWTNFGAFSSSNVWSAGDTCYISGGTYDFRLTMNYSGTVENPIVIKASQEVGHNDLVIIYVTDDFGVTLPGAVTLDGAKDDDWADSNITGTPDVYNITNNIGIRIVGSVSGDGTGALGFTKGVGCSNVLVKWVELTNHLDGASSEQYGVLIKHTSPYNYVSNVIEYCYIHTTGQDAVGWKTSNADPDPTDWTVRYCFLDDIGDDHFEIKQGITIHHNIIRESNKRNGHPDGISGSGSHIIYYNNIVYDIYGRYTYPATWTEHATNTHFYGNLIYWDDFDDFDSDAEGLFTPAWEDIGGLGPPDTNSSWTYMTFANNTLWLDGSGLNGNNSPDGGIRLFNRYAASNTNTFTCTNWVIKNNIVIGGFQTGADLKGTNGNSGGAGYAYTEANMAFDYNIVWSTNAAGRNVRYWMTNHADVLDFNDAVDSYSNNKTNEPVFVDLNGRDFRLDSSDTAALNAGTDLSSRNLPGLDTDLWGNTRGSDGTWDIGAHEYTDSSEHDAIGVKGRTRFKGRTKVR